MSDDKPSVKDIFGNEVHVGDTVCFNYRPERAGLCIARIVDIKEGGVAVPINNKQQAVTPKLVRLIIDMTLTMDPRIPAFSDIAKIVSPKSDEVLNEALKNMPSGPHIV